MKTIHVPLVEKREIAENTYLYSFKKPDDFSYTAGQYISLSVEKPEIAAPGGTMRELSLSSAPYEPVLSTALRFRESAAKRQYHRLQIGDHAYIQGPFGEFALQKEDHPIVFLAGGIGMTPLLSLLKQALHEKRQNAFTIFSSNRRSTDIPDFPEMKQLLKKNKQVRLVNTLTLNPPQLWKEEHGYLTAAMIKKYIPVPSEHHYYIAGPQRFVGGMWDLLDELAVPVRHIHGEEFTGY